MIYYLRDSNSKLIGLKYNNNLYYYQKNIQDDIIGLLDSNYNLVAQYLYDSWGNIISIKDNSGNEITDTSNIAHINPYRYRSYYYDKETKLYYLNSRYYNPAWGRFINADGIINADEVINGFNLYAYTTNNPIKYIDDTGKGGLLAGILYLGAQFITAAVATIAAYALLQDATEAVVSVSTRPNGIKKKKKDEEEQDPKIYYVYTLYDPFLGRTTYVGRIKNLKNRLDQHGLNPAKQHLVLGEYYKKLTYAQARGKEQELIVKYSTINKGYYNFNQINGINPMNPNYDKYMNAILTIDESETYVGGNIEWDQNK